MGSRRGEGALYFWEEKRAIGSFGFGHGYGYEWYILNHKRKHVALELCFVLCCAVLFLILVFGVCGSVFNVLR